MREADLFPLIKAWLEARGCEVFAEVAYPWADLSSMDVVGLPDDDGPPLVVQLKTSFSKSLANQCRVARILTSQVWAAAPTKPRKRSTCWLDAARRDGLGWGFGILRVHDGAVSELLAPPESEGFGCFDYGKKIRERLEEDREAYQGAIGGVPCTKGVGPAQSVRKAIDAYRKEHPDARRREIFKAVPNHYASMESMFSAMSGLRQRLWWAEAKKSP